MTVLAVSIAVESAGEVDEALERASRAVTGGARLVEWRVDALAEGDRALEAAGALVRRSPLPSIVTCRAASEGGAYRGDEATRAALYETLVLADEPPRYIDVELAAWRASPTLRRRIGAALEQRRDRDVRASLILSVHDFDRRPADLLQRVESMAAEPACSVMKVAWSARSVRDNLEALDLLAERAKPMICLCMGRFGLLSRALAPRFGGLLVYAAAAADALTAPGQPTLDELRRYRFDSIGRHTRVYGVIGWPVEHSQSPAVHNAGFDAVGHDGVYLPLPVPPEYEHLKATLGALLDHERLGFRGASVTVPHKEHLVRFVRERGGVVDPGAQLIGAANTLLVGDDGSLQCLNTDGTAALDALCSAMGIEPADLGPKRVAVLGAGGVARAVVSALSGAGAAVTVFNRTRRRAETLAQAFPGVTVGSSPAGGGFDVYVNCTPLGMAGGPGPDESPLPGDAPLDESVTVFDTVYTPGRTPLLEQAEAAGALAVGGLDMFLGQAALQFQRWTGHPAPLKVFREAISLFPNP